MLSDIMTFFNDQTERKNAENKQKA